MSKPLPSQIELALCAYATAKGATITQSLRGSKLIELVVDQTIDLTEAAQAVAKELSK